MQSNDEGAQILQQKGIKPSFARLQIYQYLRERRNHPTADDIYLELVKMIPTLSRTTVYNTLSLLLENHLLQLVTIEDNELRYDADTGTHGHFKCFDCGKIYDFSLNCQGLETQGLEGFEVKQKSVYYAGRCKQCSDKLMTRGK